ncbi:hypothetical protein CCGE532_30230 (plasmid) [Rhizobium sp. CCGE532]|nr:hypothetical protein CCGE532_30230 [Rhizobium sp. CCGE532]
MLSFLITAWKCRTNGRRSPNLRGPGDSEPQANKGAVAEAAAIAPGLFWKTIRKDCGFDETLGRMDD